MAPINIKKILLVTTVIAITVVLIILFFMKLINFVSQFSTVYSSAKIYV